MQPFEERLTAWIDDRLPAEEHAAFERELAAHPDAPAFHAEKRHVGQLRALLRDHLQAPALPSPDFFNHGILERIAAESRREERQAAAVPASRSTGAWGRFLTLFGTGGLTPTRLLAAGAACLLAASVGIYALIPASPGGGPGGTAQTSPPSPMPPAPTQVAIEPMPAASAPPAAPGPRSRDDGQFALNNRPAPDPLPPAPTAPPASTTAPKPEAPTTSATLLHFDEQNADVLWLDGLDYLPEVNAGTPATPAAADPAPSPRQP